MTVETEYTRIMRTVRTRLPGALDSATQHEIFEVLDEFFDKSNVWQETIRFSALTTKLVYEIEPEASSATILRLIKLENADETPIYGTMQTPGELVLDSYPSETQYYYATVSLGVTEPLRTDEYPKCPEWVLKKYRDVIVDGVLGRMMSQMAKPYTNERMAIYHMRRFQSGCGTAKHESLHMNIRSGQAWRFPQGFARMSRRQ